MFYGQVTWERFVVDQNDAMSIQNKFESLCRQLFKYEFCSKNYNSVYCNPNNPGLEADSVYDECLQRRIGFQVKYFDGNVDYNQIKHSAEKIIEYYDGKVDVVYLFSNRSITKTSKSYIEIVEKLNRHNIAIELIVNEAILDLVRKYPNLAKYYFDGHGITLDWIEKHNDRMLDALGVRFNREFNVNTNSSLHLSLFTRNSAGINYVNFKKSELLKKIDSLGWKYRKYDDYLNALKNWLLNISDVIYENVEESFEWRSKVESELGSYICVLDKEKAELDIKLEKAYKEAFENENTRKEAESKYFDLKYEQEILFEVLDLINVLEIEEYEKNLITGKVLFVTGTAGIGKSHLFANEVNMLSQEKRDSLLLLGGLYFTNEPIEKQIANVCGFDCSLDYMLEILETIGECKDRSVILFIDALNETWNKDLWLNYLPTIVSKIERYNHIKLALSYRIEYENLLINTTLLERLNSGSICRLNHFGFRGYTIKAMKEFCNYYNIPFTATEFFEYEMNNPLFLTLYCRTYNGDEVNIAKLYNRILKCANENIYTNLASYLRSCGYSKEIDIISPFVYELAGMFVNNKCKSLTREELLNLNYWRIYNNLPIPVLVSALAKENILHSYVWDSKETFYFAYDQMNDYYCAKYLVDSSESVDDVKLKLIDVLCMNKHNKVIFGNEDLFTNVSMLCSKKFKEECLDLLDVIDDSTFRCNVMQSYMKSYQWRDKDTISTKGFLDLIKRYSVSEDVLWETLIATSVRVNHPLNAIFLNEFLKGLALNKRDRLWTTYINNIWGDESNRLVQLIDMYNCGSCLEMDNKEQKKLLLILLGWLLTASNRKLRDYTSKAMVEILKNDFDLCEGLLATFNGVDDPYVVQRLYGIVFGACCKRTVDDYNTYLNLAEYVYSTIFNQEYIYPDILLRDYARLIIERFLWEYPDYKGIIVKERILPPYKSYDIPVVEEDYSSRDTYYKFDYGTQMILSSMRFETMGGMYGDFGRYVFQSALRNFDVDLKQIYNYSISFIINELSYKDEWFTDYDNRAEGYNNPRYNGPRNERIGKKYQWIAMYNILARVSDNCKIVEPYSTDETELKYEGPWEPFVRDFDPTLNEHFMICNDVPRFNEMDDFIEASKCEHNSVDINSKSSVDAWLNSKGYFIDGLSKTLILDGNGKQWVTLTKYVGTGHQNMKETKLLSWCWMYAYFITLEQEKLFYAYANKGVDFLDYNLCAKNETYVVYNREYPWSNSCQRVKDYAYRNTFLKTGDKEIVTEEKDVIKSFDFENGITFGKEMETYEKDIEISIGKILTASTELSWSEEFDLSKPEVSSRDVPCADLIECLNLRQLNYDGVYYDVDGELAAFDTRDTQNIEGVVVRKDLIDKFLEIKNLRLLWIINAAKEEHTPNLYISNYSEWAGMISYDGNSLRVNINKKNRKYN